MSQYQNAVSFQAPTDFNMEQAAVERQRKLAEAMMMRGQQPQQAGQMVSGHYVPQSWTQGLAQALQGPAGMYAARQADEQSKDIATRQRKAYADELTKFGELANGTPAQPEVQGNNPSAFTPAQAAQPGDRRAALAMALGAQNPALQQYGMSQIMPKPPEWALGERFNQQTGQPEKFMFDKNNPASQQAIGGQKAVTGTAVNGQLVNPATGATIGAAIPKQLAPDSVVTMGPGGALTPNAPVIAAKSQIAAAGKSNNSTTVINQGPKEFEKELGQLDAKTLDRYRTNAETAQSTIGTVQALRNAEKQGAYSGGGANTKLAVASLINGITGVEPKGLVGSQVYNAEASKLVLDRVKALGANPSNADRDFIEKTVPQLATSATARAQMADYMEKKAAQSIDMYKRADSHARKNHGLGGFEQFPAPATAPGSVYDEADAILRGGK